MKSKGTESCRIQDELVTKFIDNATLAMFSVSMNLTRLHDSNFSEFFNSYFIILHGYTGYGAAIFVFLPVLLVLYRIKRFS
jgi:hypothetical protein